MSDSGASNKRIAKNSIFLSIRMIVVLVISLYTTRVLLQELGVVDYGVYNVVCGFVLMFGFLNTSMSNGIQRFYNYEYGKNGEEGANKVYCTSLYIQILLAVIVAIVLEIVGLWYLNNKMVIPLERLDAAIWIFHFSIVAFVLGILQAPYAAAVTAHEKFDFYAIVSVLDVVLKLIIVYLLRVIPKDKLVVYGFLVAVIGVINLLLYYIYCKKKFNEICFARGRLDKDLFKKMLSFSGWNLFGSFSGVMEVQGINLVLNFFYGPVVNAARGVAAQINAGVQAFVSNITMPVRPQVTQSYARGEYDRTMNLTFSVSKLGSAIILIISIPAAIEIDYILELWLGNNIPDHTATFTVLVLITQLVNSLNAAISNVVHATGIMRDYQLWSSIIRLLSIPSSIAILHIYDLPELALISVFVFSCISHFVGLLIVRNIVTISLRKYFKEVVLRTLLVMIICTIVVYIPHVLLPVGILRLMASCLLSVLAVSIAFYYVAFDENEKNLSKQMIKPLCSFFK